MTAEEILQEIRNGITGDPEKDIAYLNEKAEQYRGHAQSKEILRGIGRMVWQCMPEGSRDEFDRLIRKDLFRADDLLEEADFQFWRKEYDRAEELYRAAAERLEKGLTFEDDTVSVYRDFAEPFEAMLWLYRQQEKRKLRRPTGRFAETYLKYGSFLIERKKFREARAALEKARRWDPVNADIHFEYTETYKLNGEFAEFLRLSREALGFVFRPNALARAYRNIAYYYTETEQYRTAVALLHLSRLFDPEAEQVAGEFRYIMAQTGELPDVGPEEIGQICREQGIPIGADPETEALAFQCGKRAYESGEWEAAEYYLTIFYDLTEDTEARDLLEEVREKRLQ